MSRARTFAALLVALTLAFVSLVPQASAQTGDDMAAEIAPLDQVSDMLALIGAAGQGWDVLVIELPGGEDFAQFSTDLGQVTLDFPVFTPRQEQLLPQLEVFLRAEGLTHTWIELEGGRTLIAGLGEGLAAARRVTDMIDAVFSVKSETEVRFILIRF